MDYASFKNHLAVFLWKDTDLTLLERLDSLVDMANAALARDLRYEKRHKYATLQATGVEVSMPADYYSLLSLANEDQKLGAFEEADSSYIVALRGKTANNAVYPVYSIVDTTLQLVGPMSPTAPLNLVLHYRAGIPDFKTDDTSWVADTMLDLYTYAVLKHTGMFLREDERVASWNALYMEAVESANQISAEAMARGQMQAQLPSRAAGVARKGDRSGYGKLTW